MRVQHLPYLDSQKSQGKLVCKVQLLRAVIIPELHTFISDNKAIVGSFS